MVKEQYHEADVCKKIAEIQFSIFSPDDMAKSSHIQVLCIVMSYSLLTVRKLQDRPSYPPDLSLTKFHDLSI